MEVWSRLIYVGTKQKQAFQQVKTQMAQEIALGPIQTATLTHLTSLPIQGKEVMSGTATVTKPISFLDRTICPVEPGSHVTHR